MSIGEITAVREGPVLHLELNRPAKRNALTAPMYGALADELLAAETDGTRIVLFSGAGHSFCGGNDMADFIATRPQGEEPPVRRFLRAIATSTRILVAAVQGPAIGVGTTMLLHCDFAIAEENARLQMPFVDLSIVPEAGSSLLVPALVGHRRACELLLLSESVSAERAHALGLVNKVVPAGRGLAEARALVARLAAKPAMSLLATKKLMKSTTTDMLARMDEEFGAFAAQLESPELKAMVAGFFAARGAPSATKVA